MDDSRSDAALVAAHLSGDRSALAAIYDRYAASLHDLAAGMLRDPESAADTVQDVFVAAAGNLDRLREPERLRAWLFAIARHEVYRRTKARSRSRVVDFTDEAAVASIGVGAMAAPAEPDAEAANLVAEDLARQVRAAAAGLDPRDQLVLELVVRQGLGGRDLADALGVTEARSHVLVHRMRERVSRSLGALTVARMGRRDCDALAAVLRDWDGRFTVLVRKRVARHVDGCAVCARTSTRYAALALLASAAPVAAPEQLRERVLSAAWPTAPSADAAADASADPGGAGADEAGGAGPGGAGPGGAGPGGAGPGGAVVSGATAYRFDAPGGFPRHARRSRPQVVAAVVVLLLLTVAAGGWAGGLWGPARFTHPQTAASPTPATSVGSAPAASDGAEVVTPGASPSASPSSSPSSSPSLPPTTSVPGPGQLTLGSTVVDLGASDPSGQLLLRNTGASRLDWAATGVTGPWRLSPTAGSLEPGSAVGVTVTVSRVGAEGERQGRVEVRSSGLGGGAVSLRATVERPPVIDVVRAPTTLRCPWSVPPLLAVTVRDESAVPAVDLRWSGPALPGESSMTQPQPGQWVGRLGLAQAAGTWTWRVSAADARGNVAVASGTVLVTGPC